ncbi:hypothetical protein [Staphylococcus simiae]|uniref:Putative lipoprotein n=1 Tax=Staphylococcus simiae CCM 7213 = CCUG 51256 TaxID=911238 RepID=G5JJX5_9STAP|nr:hypothetical protein [Staphylococcus simiae]EHJ07530.1 putative lipoprotein [Staphylococcus simiae CCM 7213 = CCUG 51256]PNZ08878.1 hypothetical protein CD113_12470 [Staphylococcus simiae]SNV75270.1 putative lipoprotein [Staphylococcus simiae]
MKFKLLGVSLLSSALLLTACGQHENNTDKNDDKKTGHEKKTKNKESETKKQTKKDNNEHVDKSNNQKKSNYTNPQSIISPKQAEVIVHDDYINNGATEAQVKEFKTNLQRSNENQYLVEYLVADGAGYPINWAATVDKISGNITSKFNDMTDKQSQEYEKIQENSPMYPSKTPNKNNDKKVDLNNLPALDFSINGMSREHQKQVNQLSIQKDNGEINQHEYNEKVSAIMNNELENNQ